MGGGGEGERRGRASCRPTTRERRGGVDLSSSRERRGRERDRQNSELYYSRIEILGSSLFLQSVLAMLHRQHI